MIESLSVGPLGECCYILHNAGASDCILVDPGDEAERILALLDKLALSPSLIVATHGHLDHTAAIPALLAALAGRGLAPQIAVHAEDSDYFGEGAREKNLATFTMIRATGFFRHYFAPLPAAGLILADGDSLPGGAWRVIHTPGHTRGSICLYSASEASLISGDTLFLDGVGRTDGPDSDPAALAASLEKKLFLLPPETRVFPGHGGPTTIARERG
jgi:glyoxylase-like metal-dependent hydrolase (beta-lactamase superfamily II)